MFAGDAYKNRNPSQTHQREFAKRIQRLSTAGIPTVLVEGNHDTPSVFGRATSLDIFKTLIFSFLEKDLLQVNPPLILPLFTFKSSLHAFPEK